jgi:hypothetical protein
MTSTVHRRPRPDSYPNQLYAPVPQSPRSVMAQRKPVPRYSIREPAHSQRPQQIRQQYAPGGRGVMAQSVATGAIGAGYGPYSVRIAHFAAFSCIHSNHCSTRLIQPETKAFTTALDSARLLTLITHPQAMERLKRSRRRIRPSHIRLPCPSTSGTKTPTWTTLSTIPIPSAMQNSIDIVTRFRHEAGQMSSVSSLSCSACLCSSPGIQSLLK